MQPLNSIEASVCQNIKCIFSDIDDTISTRGKITDDAYSAIWRAANSGIDVIPVTGRPAGWVDHIARMWPVRGVIGENGAFYFYMQDGKLHKRFLQSDDARAENRKKLDHIYKRIKDEIPNAVLASDQDYREADLAVDYTEDIPRLRDNEIDRIIQIFHEEGAICKMSSIHVNGWYGDFDKIKMVKTFVNEQLGMNYERDRLKFIYIGDSPNDEPMFSEFKYSVGVSNILDFKGKINSWPTFITTKSHGAGFAELIETLIDKKNRRV